MVKKRSTHLLTSLTFSTYDYIHIGGSFKAQSHASQQHDPVRAALELVSLTVDGGEGGRGGGAGERGYGGHEGREDDLSPPSRLASSTGSNRNKMNNRSKISRGSSDVEQFRALDALVFQAAVANMVQVRIFALVVRYQLVGVHRLFLLCSAVVVRRAEHVCLPFTCECESVHM